VLGLLALDEGRVDRAGEGGVVELDGDVLGAGILGGFAPARAELDAVGGDPEVGAGSLSLATGLMVALVLMLRVRIVPVKTPSSPRAKLPI
jgi:hypothetical protein